MGEKKRKGKTGQMQIGFGVIFSVILIIIFIAFAIYGITKFMDVNRVAQLASFKTDLQEDVDKIWRSSSSSQPVSYTLPRKIKQVCFVDNDNENMYFMPDDFEGVVINHVDLPKTVASSTSRPKKLCIDSVSGEVSMILKKSYNEQLVTITK